MYIRRTAYNKSHIMKIISKSRDYLHLTVRRYRNRSQGSTKQVSYTNATKIPVLRMLKVNLLATLFQDDRKTSKLLTQWGMHKNPENWRQLLKKGKRIQSNFGRPVQVSTNQRARLKSCMELNSRCFPKQREEVSIHLARRSVTWGLWF